MLGSHKLLEQRMVTEDLFLAEVDSTLPYRVLHGLSAWISDEGVEYLQRPNSSISSLQFKTYCSRFLHKQGLSFLFSEQGLCNQKGVSVIALKEYISRIVSAFFMLCYCLLSISLSRSFSITPALAALHS